MLVLSRKIGEGIHIDGPCTITILRVAGNGVRVGLDAPATTKIVRAELETTEAAAAVVPMEHGGGPQAADV